MTATATETFYLSPIFARIIVSLDNAAAKGLSDDEKERFDEFLHDNNICLSDPNYVWAYSDSDSDEFDMDQITVFTGWCNVYDDRNPVIEVTRTYQAD